MAKKNELSAGNEAQPDGRAVNTEVPAPQAVPMAVPAGGWPVDEFSGQPGSFLRDPFTGVRTRAPDVDGAL